LKTIDFAFALGKSMSNKPPRQFEFSVIAGSLKGRKIYAPDLGITRPPLSRLRKSVFDYLKPYIDEARYLDLFSGTGSYLFEAVSRGAGRAVGVELDRQLADAINRQATGLKIADRLRCLQADVLKVLPSLAGTEDAFDIIMIAPPQYKGLIDRTLEALGPLSLAHPGTLIICQHDSGEQIEFDKDGFSVDQLRKYGNTTYTVLKLKV
jgi:16S rRNA (guanine(966)-N(2))-methyltransferase RsmD